MKKRLLLVPILLLFLILAACSPAGQTPKAKGIYFEVSGGKNTVYLLGSIHAGTKDMYPLDKAVEDAFTQAGALVVEVDMTSIDPMVLAQEMSSFGLYQDGKKLSGVVGEELFAKVLGRLSPHGIDANMLNQLKPWYAAMILSQLAVQESKYSPEHGVDLYFMNKAKGKEIIGLETVNEQLTPFTLIAEESQVIYLQETLDDLANIEEDIEELITIWREGKTERVAKLRNQMIEEAQTESLRDYVAALTQERDEKMAEKIANLIENGTHKSYFVVVGYLHLAGENSVVDYLTQKGYEVKAGN